MFDVFVLRELLIMMQIDVCTAFKKVDCRICGCGIFRAVHLVVCVCLFFFFGVVI